MRLSENQGEVPFQLVAVHDPFGDLLVCAEQAALVQQRVHQGGLAVIDMGDDGDIADIQRLEPMRKNKPRAGMRGLA